MTAASAPSPAPARQWLLDAVARVVWPDGAIEFAAPVGGAMDGLSIRWGVSGGRQSSLDASDQHRLLQPSHKRWWVAATLLRGDVPLGTVTASAPPSGTVAAATPTGAVLRWSSGRDAPPSTAVDGVPVPCAPLAEQTCAVTAAVGSVIAFPGGVVTAGAAPGAERIELEESPHECGDPRFPAPLSGGIAGCSAPGTVDRHRRRPGGPRRALRFTDIPAPSTRRSSVTAGGSRLAVVQSRRLALWSEGHQDAHLSPDLALVGAPGSDGTWLALPLFDRVQITQFGASQRRQLPASPAPGSPIHVAGDWLVWADEAANAVQLGRTADDRLGSWPGTDRDTHTVLTPGWLVLSDEERTVAWGLVGQAGWVQPGDHAFSEGPTSAGDYVALPDRDRDTVSTKLVHLPTGITVARWGTEGSWAAPRGADGSGLVLHERTPGTAGRLVRLPTPTRVFEEDGVLGLRGSSRSGGHGGRHALLAAGSETEGTLRCDAPCVLRTYRPGGPEDGALMVTVADRARRVELVGTGWVDVARLPRDTDVSVRFVADAGGEGLVVDALMVETTK